MATSLVEYQITVKVGDTFATILSRIVGAFDVPPDANEQDIYERRTTIDGLNATRVTEHSDGTMLYETKTILTKMTNMAYVMHVSEKTQRDPVDPPEGYRITKSVMRTTLRFPGHPFTVVVKEENAGTMVVRMFEIDFDGPQEATVVDGITSWPLDDDVLMSGMNFIARYYGGISIADNQTLNDLYVRNTRNTNINVMPLRPFDPTKAPHYYVGPKMDGDKVDILVKGTETAIELYMALPRVPGLFLIDTLPIPLDAEGNPVYIPHAIASGELMTVPEPHIYLFDLLWINWRDSRRRIYGKSLVPRRLALGDLLQLIGTEHETGIEGMRGYMSGNTQFRMYAFEKVRGAPARRLEELEAHYRVTFTHKGMGYIDGLVFTPALAVLHTLSRTHHMYTGQPATVLKKKNPDETTADLLYYNGKYYTYSSGVGTLVPFRKPSEMIIEPLDSVYNGCVCEMRAVPTGDHNYTMSLLRVRSYKVSQTLGQTPNDTRTVNSNIREVLRPTSYADTFGETLKRTSQYLRSMSGGLIKGNNKRPFIAIGTGPGGSRWTLEENAGGQPGLLFEPNTARYKKLLPRIRDKKNWYAFNVGIGIPAPDGRTLEQVLADFRRANPDAYSTFFPSGGSLRNNTIHIFFVMTFIDPATYYTEEQDGFFDIIEKHLAPHTITLLGFDATVFPKQVWQGLGARVTRLSETTARYRVPGIVGTQVGYIPVFDSIRGEVKDSPFPMLERISRIYRSSISRKRMLKAEREYLQMMRAVRVIM